MWCTTRIGTLVVTLLFTALMAGLVPNPDTLATQRDHMTAKEQRIDITIQDSDFLFAHPVTPQLGLPTVIILRNNDIIRHGFTSTILKGVEVTAEGEGITAQPFQAFPRG